MASFTNEDTSRLDFQLIVHGGVTLFHRRAHFERTHAALVEMGYAVRDLDARSVAQFSAAVTRVLRWKERFGYEAEIIGGDALNDGFVDFAWSPEEFEGVTGIVFRLQRFDLLVAEDSAYAADLLEMLAEASRVAMVFGQRLFAIVQTNDPRYLGRWNGTS